MSYLLTDLVVDRVDFVDEGANSAAFIELFKRKEPGTTMVLSEIVSKLKPEHAEVINNEIAAVKEELAKAKEELETVSKANEEANEALAQANEELEILKAKNTGEDDDEANKQTSFDEAEVLKAMPEEIRTEFLKMRAQKEAAEEQVRKAAEERLEAEAVAKANTMKALPVEQDVLVNILKSCDQTVADVLAAAAAAVETAALEEVGKSTTSSTLNADAWDKIEKEAEKLAEEENVTKQKAISMVIKSKPELYREYLNGGAE